MTSCDPVKVCAIACTPQRVHQSATHCMCGSLSSIFRLSIGIHSTLDSTSCWLQNIVLNTHELQSSTLQIKKAAAAGLRALHRCPHLAAAAGPDAASVVASCVRMVVATQGARQIPVWYVVTLYHWDPSPTRLLGFWVSKLSHPCDRPPAMLSIGGINQKRQA
jgi:hypothetical protein